MAKLANPRITLELIYDGAGPVFWDGTPVDFGLQDRSNDLGKGDPVEDGGVSFTVSLEVKRDGANAPSFLGPFAHGAPGERFLYLSWRNRDGAYAQRLKIPLGSIGLDEVRQALTTGHPLVARLVDWNPRATSTGANIGGTRHVIWRVASNP